MARLKFCFLASKFHQDDARGGLSLRRVAFMTALAVFTNLAVLQNTLPSVCWSYKIQDKEGAVAVLAVVAVSVVTATPLKLNPPFPSSWFQFRRKILIFFNLWALMVPQTVKLSKSRLFHRGAAYPSWWTTVVDMAISTKQKAQCKRQNVRKIVHQSLWGGGPRSLCLQPKISLEISWTRAPGGARV